MYFYLQQVNKAIALLYARKVLIALLAHWPENGPDITAELIGCKQDGDLPFVLDLLSGEDSKESFRKVGNANIFGQGHMMKMVIYYISLCSNIDTFP